MFYCHFVSVFAVVVLGFVSSLLSQEIGFEERLRNDPSLCQVGRKPVIQSISGLGGHCGAEVLGGCTVVHQWRGLCYHTLVLVVGPTVRTSQRPCNIMSLISGLYFSGTSTQLTPWPDTFAAACLAVTFTTSVLSASASSSVDSPVCSLFRLFAMHLTSAA